MNKTLKEIERKQKKADLLNREWYSLRSLIGNDWAIFFFMLGGREAGKSYATTEFFVRQWRRYGRPFYWMRLSETSAKKLLTNNAEKLIDPDLRRKYGLDLVTNAGNVYEVTKRDKQTGKIKEKKLMARVLALATFYNDKGSGLFDKDFLNDPNMFYNIALDEMNRELNEKKTFDILYAFTNQLENLVRSTKQRLRVLCIGNTLEEASDLLCAFDFIPEQFGRFKLKSKRAVVEYIEPSEKYLTRRKGTVADILMPNASTFTNRIETDDALVNKKRMIRPTRVIKFSRDDLFTVWDDRIISEYHDEKVPITAMRPYIDELYSPELRDNVFMQFNARAFQFHDLITFKKFQKALELLKPRM